MKQGIIFDMDGTLWDAGESVAAAWNIVLKRQKVKRAELTIADVHGVMGKTIEGVADALLGDYPKEERIAITRECLRFQNGYLAEHGGRLYEGLEEVLKELSAEYPLYIVSNCEKGYIEGFLEYYGFAKYFKDFESHGNTMLTKGKNIKLVAERNGLSEAVYIGDIQGDYDAGREAGTGFIHAAYGFGKIDALVPAIQCIAELPAAVREYFNGTENA